MAKNFKNGRGVHVSAFSYTEKRKRELSRVRKIISRAKKAGLELEEGFDITNLHTNELKNIKSKKDLQRKGYLETKEKAEIRHRIMSTTQPRNVVNISDAANNRYIATGENIDRENVLSSDGAKEQIDMLENIIRTGENYIGGHSLKDTTGAPLVQRSADRIGIILETARARHTDEELVKAINDKFGSIAEFARLLERLILALYDDVYAAWAGGNAAYERAISMIANTLGGDDLGW